jgi:hypothetical protein
LPVPAGVPPQEPENHSALAPVPAVPPLKVRVVDAPEQIVLVPVILVGATDTVFTVKVLVADLVVQFALASVYVIVTELPEPPVVITPVEEFIVAIPVLLLDQEPPRTSELKVVVPPKQMV